MTTTDELEKRVAEILPEIAVLRHELHRIPEMAGKEFRTSARIRETLAGLNLEIGKPYLETDVTAILNRGKPGNLTLRADMDALPLTETAARPYASLHPGMMHACGHDGHAAMLCGAAKILSALRDEVPCSVRFLFQPGEEVACMAKPLLEAGALSDPEPDFITGLHSWPHEPYGRIVTRPGALMAAAGFFKIVLHGKGGHGSLPKFSNNPIDTAAELVTACRKLVPPDCVLTFCRIAGGGNSTIIPDRAELEGTIRFFDPEKGRRLVAAFESEVIRIAGKNHIRCEFSCPVPYPVVHNRKEDFAAVRKLIEENLGADAFYELPEPTTSSEDFAWYLEKYHGVFCHLGSGDSAPLHSAGFDFDDRLLSKGIRYFCLCALNPPWRKDIR